MYCAPNPFPEIEKQIIKGLQSLEENGKRKTILLNLIKDKKTDENKVIVTVADITINNGQLTINEKTAVNKDFKTFVTEIVNNLEKP